MTTNGHGKYELTQHLELWTDKDLANYVLDTDSIMGLEKFEIVKLAQEIAMRYEPFIGDEFGEEEDDESSEHEYNE